MIGLSSGAGAAFGVIAAGLLARAPQAAFLAAVVAALAAAVISWVVFDWKAALAAAIAGILAGIGAAGFAQGTLRRGGTPGGTGFLLGLIALGVFLVALVPFAGYLEAVLLPALALRARRRADEKYAGLRTLAK